MGFTWFEWVLVGFTWFYRVVLGFTGSYWVLLGYLWVVLGFRRIKKTRDGVGCGEERKTSHIENKKWK